MSELFSARLKKLSGDELKNAFGERAKVKCTEDFFPREASQARAKFRV